MNLESAEPEEEIFAKRSGSNQVRQLLLDAATMRMSAESVLLEPTRSKVRSRGSAGA